MPSPVYTEAVLYCADWRRSDLFETFLFPHNSMIRLPALGTYFGHSPEELCRHMHIALRGHLSRDATLFVASHAPCGFWDKDGQAQAEGAYVVEKLRQATFPKVVGVHIDEKKGITLDDGGVSHSFVRRLKIRAAQFPPGGCQINESVLPEEVVIGAHYFLGQCPDKTVRLLARFVDERVATVLAKLFGGVIPAPTFLPAVSNEDRQRIQSLFQHSLAAV